MNAQLRPARWQRGLSLVEVMVSLVLGMLVTLAGLTLFLSSRAAYSAVDDQARMAETGAFALDLIARSIRQTAYVDWSKEDSPFFAEPTAPASIAGLDNARLGAATAELANPETGVNGSDAISLAFFGAGSGANGNRTVTNCAGFGVPEPSLQSSAAAQRGRSIFYIARNTLEEPELRCKYRAVDGSGSLAWKSEAIATGVESLQFLYGLDNNNDGIADRYYSATAVNAMDARLVLGGATPELRELDKNRQTNWKKVVAVQVAVLVRGNQKGKADLASGSYALFGAAYGASADDPGAILLESSLGDGERNRARRIFNTTVMLRNQGSGSGQ